MRTGRKEQPGGPEGLGLGAGFGGQIKYLVAVAMTKKFNRRVERRDGFPDTCRRLNEQPPAPPHCTVAGAHHGLLPRPQPRIREFNRRRARQDQPGAFGKHPGLSQFFFQVPQEDSLKLGGRLLLYVPAYLTGLGIQYQRLNFDQRLTSP